MEPPLRSGIAWILLLSLVASLASLAPVAQSATLPEWKWQWSNPMPTGNHLIQIAFDGGNPGQEGNHGYIIADNGEILHSSDGGQTWNLSGQGSAKWHFTASVIRQDFFLSVDNQGHIWKHNASNRAEVTWRATDSLGQPLLDIRACNEQTYLAVGRNGLIARSNDRGENWAPVHFLPGGPPLIGLYCSSSGHAVAVGDSGFVLRSQDFGSRWESLHPPTFEMLTGVTFADALLGWVTTNQGKVAMTQDGGLTWKLVELEADYFLRHIHWRSGHLSVTGSDGRFWTSSDRGETWTSKPSPTEYYLAASAINAVGERLVVGNAGTVLRGDALGNGLQFISKGSMQEVQGLSVLAPSTWFAYGANGLLLKSSDAGSTWREQTGWDRYLSATFRGHRGLLAGYNGTLVYSEDAGENWHPAQSPTLDGPLFGVAWSDSNSAVAVGYGATLLRTTDAGHHWQPLRHQLELGQASLSAVCFKPNGTGFIAGYRGTLLSSQDGGETWSKVSLMSESNLYALSFRDDSVGMVVGAKGLVLVTRDGGQTWKSETTGVQDDYLFSIIWLGGDTAMVSGAWGHTSIVRMTTDAGKTWVTVAVPASNLVYNLTRLDTRRIAAVGSSGLILIGEVNPSTLRPTLPGSGGLNPFSYSVQRSGITGLAAIHLSLPVTGVVSISAHSMDGRFSETVYRGNLSAGQHRVNVNKTQQRGPTFYRAKWTRSAATSSTRQ